MKALRCASVRPATFSRSPTKHPTTCSWPAVLALPHYWPWPNDSASKASRLRCTTAPVRANADRSLIDWRVRRLRIRFSTISTTALQRSGWTLPPPCSLYLEQGVCGTCLTRVKAGTPDHRDQYLTDAEQALNDRFQTCCSRAKPPRLVLGL